MIHFQYSEWETQIEAYLYNKMTPADRLQFEQLMQQNPDLKAAVGFDQILKQKAEIVALTQYAHRNWDALNQAQQSHATQWMRYKWFGLIVILSLGFWAGSRYLTQRPIQNWLALNLQPLELVDEAFHAEGTELLALKAYQSRQFEVAEALFTQEDSLKNIKSFMRLYRAINALCVKPPQTHQAIPILEGFYRNQTPFKSESVQWYLMLAYLQQREWEKARKVAAQIPAESPYFKQAQVLIPKIPY